MTDHWSRSDRGQKAAKRNAKIRKANPKYVDRLEAFQELRQAFEDEEQRGSKAKKTESRASRALAENPPVRPGISADDKMMVLDPHLRKPPTGRYKI